MQLTHLRRTLVFLGATLGLSAQHAELSQIQTVYLMPMGNAMDQYLARNLTRLGPFQVVTDPLRADAVFTDRLGQAFETRFAELFGEEEQAATPAPRKEGTEQEKETSTDQESVKSPPPVSSSFGRGKGNIFLVDRKSRRVVWAGFEKPRFTTPESLDAISQRMVKQLKRDHSGK
jgi:hypothetical protein